LLKITSLAIPLSFSKILYMSASFLTRIYRLIVLLFGLWLGFDLASRLTAEYIWFQEVGYLSVFLLRLKTQAGLWAIAFFTSSGYLLGNLALAHRLKYPKPQVRQIPPIQQYPSALNLRWLLPIVAALSIFVWLILIYYSQAALNSWHPNISIPPPFHLATHLTIQILLVSVLLGLSILLLINPQWLNAISLIISLIFAGVLSEHWANILQYIHPIKFNHLDPLFAGVARLKPY